MQRPDRKGHVRELHRSVSGGDYTLPREFSSAVTTPNNPKYNHEEWVFSVRGAIHPNYREAVKNMILTQLNRVQIIKIEIPLGTSIHTKGLNVRIWIEVGIICIKFPQIGTPDVWNISFIPFDDPDNYKSLRGGGWQLRETQLTLDECAEFQKVHTRVFVH